MDKISALWQGASYQDNLLQSYRNFHLTTQSIFIAIGVGLSVTMISVNGLLKQLLIYMLLLLISGLGIYLLQKMRKLIIARGEDVNHFHNNIIDYERTLPKIERVLTAFKVYQKYNRQGTDINSFNNYFENLDLNEEVLASLVESGNGHTRQFLDRNLFIWFYIIWFSFHIVGITIIIETVLNK